jgi:hypothetical protein
MMPSTRVCCIFWWVRLLLASWTTTLKTAATNFRLGKKTEKIYLQFSEFYKYMIYFIKKIG